MILAQVDFSSPLLWAVLIGWVLSVTLHEFAHGLAAHLGGDWTIRERGGLTLNPLQYVDPLMSIALPVVFLLMGGIPLPGGATYIRRDLLRSRVWESGVSAAGPAMNFLLFVLLAAAVHPAAGWTDPDVPVAQWTTAQLFVGAMAFLQLFAVLLNLFPVPPLDGFGIIAPWLNPELRYKMTSMGMILFIGYFILLWRVPVVIQTMFSIMGYVTEDVMGLNFFDLLGAFRIALWGRI